MFIGRLSKLVPEIHSQIISWAGHPQLETPLGKAMFGLLNNTNTDVMNAAVEALEVNDASRILEIGFGSGYALEQYEIHLIDHGNIRLASIVYLLKNLF